MAGLAQQAGNSAFAARCADLQSYARRLAKASMANLPRGRFRYRDLLDDDGFGHFDIPVCVSLEISAGGISVDFEGTAAQVAGTMNCPLAVTAAAVFYVFRCLMPAQIPPCHGAMAMFDIRAPRGCLVNAVYPAAVAAGNVETSMRIVDAVCGALARALPDSLPAASQGTMNNLAMGAREGAGWDYYETLGGGSGGRGAFFGGDGVLREYEFLADAELSVLSERRRHGPWGLNGGAAGAPGRNLLDGEEVGGKCQLSVKAGQVLRIETPGGGGYGQPRAG